MAMLARALEAAGLQNPARWVREGARAAAPMVRHALDSNAAPGDTTTELVDALVDAWADDDTSAMERAAEVWGERACERCALSALSGARYRCPDCARGGVRLVHRRVIHLASDTDGIRAILRTACAFNSAPETTVGFASSYTSGGATAWLTVNGVALGATRTTPHLTERAALEALLPHLTAYHQNGDPR